MNKNSKVLEDVMDLLDCFKKGTLPEREINFKDVCEVCDISDVTKYHFQYFPHSKYK